MVREKLLHILAGLIGIIAVLHIGATVFYLYWTYWWFDLPLHFLGGIFIALLALWVVFLSGYAGGHRVFSVSRGLLLALVSAFLVGIGWETFEWFLGHTWDIERHFLDTGIDLFLDVVGGLIGFFFFARQYLKYELGNTEHETEGLKDSTQIS